MAVPDFQSLMLPLLRIAGDGREDSLAEARETLAGEFKLSAAEQDEPLPSGSTPTISTRRASSRTSRAVVGGAGRSVVGFRSRFGRALPRAFSRGGASEPPTLDRRHPRPHWGMGGERAPRALDRRARGAAGAPPRSAPPLPPPGRGGHRRAQRCVMGGAEHGIDAGIGHLGTR